MTGFPCGAEWRKWDLHIHAPGTKLNDAYGAIDWDQFCQIIHESDVAVVAIADYFSFQMRILRSWRRSPSGIRSPRRCSFQT